MMWLIALLLNCLLQIGVIYPVYDIAKKKPEATTQMAETTYAGFWIITGLFVVCAISIYLWSRTIASLLNED